MGLQFSLSGPDEKGVEERLYDVVVIGSGPAGLVAALYASRASLATLLLTGNQIGGQIALTWEVDNYPGFPEGLTGPELVERLKKHAERFGAKVEMDEVTALDLSERPFTITTYGGDYRAKTLILATGASPRRLGIPGETEFTGRGVSYCATCDGWFFRDKNVAVVGGGDSALEEALFLTKHASKVTVIHRRDELRAGPALQSRARENDKIEFIWDTVVEEVVGEDGVKSLRLRNVKTGELSEFLVDGVFIFVGHIPNTQLYRAQLEMDDHGYLETNMRMQTSVEGVWAAGEVGDPRFRQVITSAGMGAAAAIEAQRWLDTHD
jgi:thioredoxin reductase (NADPH)